MNRAELWKSRRSLRGRHVGVTVAPMARAVGVQLTAEALSSLEDMGDEERCAGYSAIYPIELKDRACPGCGLHECACRAPVTAPPTPVMRLPVKPAAEGTRLTNEAIARMRTTFEEIYKPQVFTIMPATYSVPFLTLESTASREARERHEREPRENVIACCGGADSVHEYGCPRYAR